jgi:predicted N-acetyltransferase YhbS
MELIIRKTNKNEFYQTENLTRETFWNLYQSGCTEHYILHRFRKSKAWIEQLDRVAMYEGEIVGHIISTKAKVIASDNTAHEVLHVGPFTVDQLFQNKGIGTQLFHDSIETAKKLGFKGMILFGNPDYYPRFGFKNAKEFNISTKDGMNFDPFMALELQNNGLSNVHGRFYLDESAEINEQELSKYENHFPYKEKGEPKFKINV